MANLVVFVNYEVLPEKRNDYLSLMREIKNDIISRTDIKYNVFESKNKQNFFSEVIQCDSREKFNNFNQISSSSNRLNFLLREVDKCIKSYSHFNEEAVPTAA
jgi:predicted S18 family serine protease